MATAIFIRPEGRDIFPIPPGSISDEEYLQNIEDVDQQHVTILFPVLFQNDKITNFLATAEKDRATITAFRQTAFTGMPDFFNVVNLYEELLKRKYPGVITRAILVYDAYLKPVLLPEDYQETLWSILEKCLPHDANAFQVDLLAAIGAMGMAIVILTLGWIEPFIAPDEGNLTAVERNDRLIEEQERLAEKEKKEKNKGKEKVRDIARKRKLLLCFPQRFGEKIQEELDYPLRPKLLDPDFDLATLDEFLSDPTSVDTIRIACNFNLYTTVSDTFPAILARAEEDIGLVDDATRDTGHFLKLEVVLVMGPTAAKFSTKHNLNKHWRIIIYDAARKLIVGSNQ